MTWTPDHLGPGFAQRTLELLEDDAGTVIATLVRHLPAEDPDALPGTPSSPRFVGLWLHGWNDYFHQKELARRISAAGGAFYALDLRRYGRSLREDDLPGYVTALSEYDEDISAALDVIRAEQGVGTDLVMLGHSTGGLTAALWAHRHPGALRALVLDSPWLEFQASTIVRVIATTVADAWARAQPTAVVPVPDGGIYGRVLAGWDEEKDGHRPEGTDGDQFYEGGWPTDPRWRAMPSHPVRPGWLSAVRAGQAQVAAGLDITCPILVMSSARSDLSGKWSEDSRATDTVLDVTQIAERTINLGPLVTLARFEGAIHDVFLSEGPVRARVYAEMDRWLAAYV